MAGYIPDVQKNTGLFIATTDVWEISQLMEVNVNSEEFKLLLVRLYQNINNIALALNLKDSAYYVLEEFVDGQKFFSITDDANNLRDNFRRVFNIGALGAGVTTVAHGLAITNQWTFTRIYGTATDNIGNNFYPIPFAGAAGAYISLRADLTNVIVDNNSGVAFNKCIVVLEFLKN